MKDYTGHKTAIQSSQQQVADGLGQFNVDDLSELVAKIDEYKDALEIEIKEAGEGAGNLLMKYDRLKQAARAYANLIIRANDNWDTETD